MDDVVSLVVCSVCAGLTKQAFLGANPVSNWVVGVSPNPLWDAQQNDSSLGTITHWLEYSYESSKRELLLCSPETRSLWLMQDQLSLDQGALFYFWELSATMSICLIVPSYRQSTVLYYCHHLTNSGHLSEQKTLD